MAGGGGVRVQPQDLRPGKQLPQLLLHLLSAAAHVLQKTSAHRTPLRRALRVAAVVAHEPPVGGVIRQGYAAPGALGDLPALSAKEHAAATPAVEEQNALLAPVQVLRQLPPQHRADGAAVAIADLLAQVGDDHLRQRTAVVALRQLHPVIHALLRRPGGLHRRGGGAQHQHGLVPAAEVLGYVPGVVAGGVFRLVAALLLLVQNNEAQVFQRREHR